jgi:hypothetical protein
MALQLPLSFLARPVTDFKIDGLAAENAFASERDQGSAS